MATSTGLTANGKPATRKKLQFRDTRLGVLPNTIDAFSRLTVDAATKSALTSAGAKLTVEIDTAGTRVFLADQRTGSLIGGPEDLARLGGIRAFVTRERKEAQGVEVAKETTQLAYKARDAILIDDRGYVQSPLEASYGAAVRPLLSIVNRLGDNLKKLDSNTNQEHREEFEHTLRTFFTKIRNCYFRMILLHSKGENTKGKLQELLFDDGVPEYMHTRLTNQGLVLDRAQELCRVLFPSDPSKGLALTLKEWRTQAFRDKIGGRLLMASRVALKLSNDDDFIRTICKIDSSISLTDETNPSVAKLLKCRLAVTPPMGSSRYVTEPAGKTKSGWKFPTPSMDSIQGAINALSTAILRVYSANMQSVDLVGDFYATIVPGAVKRSAVTPTNNFYVQWASAPDPDTEYNDRIIRGGSTGKARADMWRWLRTEMRLSETAEGGKSLAKALLLKENGTPDVNLTREVEIEEIDPKDPKIKLVVKKEVEYYPPLPVATSRPRTASAVVWKDNRDLLRPLTAAEIPLWKKFQEDVFPSRKKGKKKSVPIGNTLTKLTPTGIALVDELKPISSHIADRMQAWLRGFSDERVQRAAVKLAVASFDELFIAESRDSGDESDSDESDDDE